MERAVVVDDVIWVGEIMNPSTETTKSIDDSVDREEKKGDLMVDRKWN